MRIDGEGRLVVEVALPESALQDIADRVARILREGTEIDPWLTVEQAADHMGTKKHRIYNLASQGVLVGGHDGTRRLFRRSELDAYLEGRR